MATAKEKLIHIIQDLDEESAQRLLDQIDDYLLQLSLENDREFMELVERIKDGKEELIPHDEVLKRYQP